MEINLFRVDIYNEYNVVFCIFFNNFVVLYNRGIVFKGEFVNCIMFE